MDAHALTNELNDLLSVETRSMLEHLHESTPHVDASTYRIWKDLQSLAHRDTDHAARLSALLSRLNLPERPRPFPQSVGNFHFMTLQRIVPLLVDEKSRQVAAYSRAVAHAGTELDVISELESLRADNEAELKQLEKFRAALSHAAGVAHAAAPSQSGDITYGGALAVAAKASQNAKAGKA